MSGLKMIASTLYRNVFKKTSTFVLLIGTTAIVYDGTVDRASEALFSKINEGKLWKDVKKQLNLDAPQQ